MAPRRAAVKTTPPTAVERVEAEARAGKTFTVVPLAGKACRIKPGLDWKSSAFRALRTGDFETWASACLYGGDYETVWQKVDPTLRQATAFIKAWERVSGQNQGE
jgi:hypothetical protein